MTPTFDPQTALQAQAALAASLGQIALQNAQKAFGLVSQAVDQGLADGQQRLADAAGRGVPTASDTLATAVSTGATLFERHVQLAQALWATGVDGIQATGEAWREHLQAAAPRKAAKAR